MIKMTLAGALKYDPKIAQAKELILSCLKEHQKQITGIKPPLEDLQLSYNELLKQVAQERGTDLWYPFIGSGIGNGALVELLDGSVKYDFIGGIGVYHFGHSHPELISASIDGAIGDTAWQGNLQQNSDQAELISLFVKESGLDHCFLTTSGSMAVENGLKLAFQKNAPATRVLAFEKCFTGRSLACASITDKPAFRDGLPKTLDVDYIPFYNESDPEVSLRALRSHLARYPKQHAAMIFELVQGEGGFYPGETKYFKALMQELKKHSIAVIVDEVQTFGRTSRLFAFQHFGLEDVVDIVTFGKLAQVCGTLYQTHYKPRGGLLSQTFTAPTTCIHVAKTLIHLLIQQGFFGPDGKNMQLHALFKKRLEALHKKYPDKIKGPYGIGAMVAFTPLDGQPETVVHFVKELYKRGVISFIAGANPTRCRFLVPAAVVTEKEIDAVIDIVEETLVCM